MRVVKVVTLGGFVLAGACSRGEGLPDDARGGTSSSGGSNSGGTNAMGGRGGSGGGAGSTQPPEPPIQACDDAVGTGEDPLIDDFEDGDTKSGAVDGREGGWYPYDDGKAGAQTFVMDEIEGGREESTRALHTTGSGFDEWGSGFAVEVRPSSTNAAGEEISCWYDASVYEGLRFWARGHEGKPGVKLAVRVKITMPSVIPISQGGSCDPGPNEDRCYDDHGVDLTFGDEWTEYRLPFAEFEQMHWAGAVDVGPFDPHRIRKIQFTTIEDVVYDYWVDDISFY